MVRIGCMSFLFCCCFWCLSFNGSLAMEFTLRAVYIVIVDCHFNPMEHSWARRSVSLCRLAFFLSASFAANFSCHAHPYDRPICILADDSKEKKCAKVLKWCYPASKQAKQKILRWLVNCGCDERFAINGEFVIRTHIRCCLLTLVLLKILYFP